MPYQGIKFKNKIISEDAPDDTRLEELKFWCRQFHLHNFAPPYKDGSCGNLSFRLKEGGDSFIITGSRIGLKENLANDCFVEVSAVDLEKAVVLSKGKREPSSESMLHFAIYRQRKDVNAVFHGHSKEILSCKNKIGLPSGARGKMRRSLIALPETKKSASYGTLDLVKNVLAALESNFFLILKKHGFISLGKTMKEAGELVLLIEQKCLAGKQ